MKYIRISDDVWVNLDEVESITRNTNGTALLQGKMRVYESLIPFEAVLLETQEIRESEPAPAVNSPLIQPTQPAW